MDETNHHSITPKTGWSWGAFLYNAGFLIAIKQYKMLWWYLLLLIPIINIIFAIGYAIYLGTSGYALAAKGGQFSNQSEYDGYFKAIDHAGRILFFVIVIFLVLWIIFLILGFSFGFIFPHGPGMYYPPNNAGAGAY